MEANIEAKLEVGDRVKMETPLQPAYLGGPMATVTEVKESGVLIEVDPTHESEKPERVFVPNHEVAWELTKPSLLCSCGKPNSPGHHRQSPNRCLPTGRGSS